MTPSSGLSLQTLSNFIFLTTQTTFDMGSCIILALALLASTILSSCFSVASLLALSAKFMGDVMEYELGIQSCPGSFKLIQPSLVSKIFITDAQDV